MAVIMLCFFLLSGCIYQLSHAQMIVQSCVKDITVTNLAGATYPPGTDQFFIQITVDSETPKPTASATFSSSILMSGEVCFDFSTATTTIVSYYPKRGRLITFDILNDGIMYGRVTATFPDPSSGSHKSVFINDTVDVQPTTTFGGTITFSLYHQIKTSNIYLKIANRNFNVFRQCFEMNRLCIYRGGVDNPTYPTDCISNTILQASHIQLNPDENTDAANLLDSSDATLWQSTPTPVATLPIGTDMTKCWAPYSQYIVINLHAISATMPAISSISLAFTADPSLKHSGDASTTPPLPPRWFTFAFDSNLAHLTSTTSDVETDQYWAVDLQDNTKFSPEGSSVWTVNPLYFQLDTKPAANKFRMTQLTKGFGLQYLQNTALQYRSTPSPSPAESTIWNTYAAAYIDPDDVNTGTSGPYPNQTLQLAYVACKNIFPKSVPYVASYEQSNYYNSCWGYSPGKNSECYEHGIDPLNTNGGELFYPPAAYIIKNPIQGFNEETTPYCMDYPDYTPPLSIVDHWGECNATNLKSETQRCMEDPILCNNDITAFHAVPMGWECNIPNTPKPTSMPTGSPVTAQPTTITTTTSEPTTTIPTTSEPTNIPTYYPTYLPASIPTTIPTYYPTYIPTFIPTSIPTYIPTTDPTKDPTMEPTHIPTSQPIEPQPSTSPTKSPIKSPSKSPTTQSPTKAPNREGQAVADTTTNEGVGGVAADETKTIITATLNIYTLVTIIIASFILLIGVIGYIDSRVLRPNDYFKIAAIFVTMFQVFDLLSDVFFSITIAEQMEENKDNNNNAYLFLFIFSFIFIIIPIIISFCQLLNEIYKHWWFQDNIKLWLTNNSKLLYLLSICTGSSFTAVQLMNANLFQWNAFSMNLTNEQFLRFQANRIYSIVLFENLPQVILQSIYLFEIQDFDFIAISSMIFSIISIIVTIISMITEKQILNSQGFAIIEFEVTGTQIIGQLRKCQNQTKEIRNQLSGVLGLNNRLIEIMRPINIPNGLNITANIHLNHIQSRNINYKQLLNQCQENGQLAEILKNSWNLNGLPVVSKIEFAVQESQNRINSTVPIKIQSLSEVKKQNLMNYIQANDINMNNNNKSYVDVSIEGENNNTNIELEPMPKVHITPGINTGENEESDNSNSGQQLVPTYGNDYNTKGNNDEVDIIKAINKTADNEHDEIVEQLNKTTMQYGSLGGDV